MVTLTKGHVYWIYDEVGICFFLKTPSTVCLFLFESFDKIPNVIFQALPYVALLIVMLFFIYAVIGMQVSLLHSSHKFIQLTLLMLKT